MPWPSHEGPWRRPVEGVAHAWRHLDLSQTEARNFSSRWLTTPGQTPATAAMWPSQAGPIPTARTGRLRQPHSQTSTNRPHSRCSRAEPASCESATMCRSACGLPGNGAQVVEVGVHRFGRGGEAPRPVAATVHPVATAHGAHTLDPVLSLVIDNLQHRGPLPSLAEPLLVHRNRIKPT